MFLHLVDLPSPLSHSVRKQAKTIEQNVQRYVATEYCRCPCNNLRLQDIQEIRIQGFFKREALQPKKPESRAFKNVLVNGYVGNATKNCYPASATCKFYKYVTGYFTVFQICKNEWLSFENIWIGATTARINGVAVVCSCFTKKNMNFPT